MLKGLGSGYYYLYNSAFPVSLAWGFCFGVAGMKAVVFLAVLLTAAILIGRAYWRLHTHPTDRLSVEFEEILAYLKGQPQGVVWCLPPQWYDAVAYKTGYPVLYGGHGFGFKLLEPLFPRVMLSIRDILTRYNVRYLIAQDEYLPDKFLADLDAPIEKKFDTYRLFIWPGT